MNILLIHLNSLGKSFQIGLAYICSFLEERGHKISFLLLSEIEDKSIKKEIEDNKIELVLISVTTDSFELCKKIVKFIHTKFRIPIVLGGIHTTIQPEECIQLEGLLGICVGEGEYPTIELVEALEQNKDYTNIKNLWIKKDEKMYRNELRPLLQDLDSLPYPNYQIFKKYLSFKSLPIIVSRGCPYNCSYCCNHSLQMLYKGKGKYLRHHSIPYCIKTIKELLKQFPNIETIEFFDDTFTIDKQWLEGFLKEFSLFGIKFKCNTRFDLIDENLIKLLSENGCIRINAAIECGNEKIREKILRRHISDKQIIEASQILRRYNIRLYTHNMVGLPYEKEEDILKTIRLNKMLHSDVVQISIFTPYPETYLKRLCEDNNWIDKKLKVTSYSDFTILKTPFIAPHLVNYYYLIFQSMVFDRGLRLCLKKAIYWILHLYNNKPYLILRNAKINILLKAGTKREEYLKWLLAKFSKSDPNVLS